MYSPTLVPPSTTSQGDSTPMLNTSSFTDMRSPLRRASGESSLNPLSSSLPTPFTPISPHVSTSKRAWVDESPSQAQFKRRNYTGWRRTNAVSAEVLLQQSLAAERLPTNQILEGIQGPKAATGQPRVPRADKGQSRLPRADTGQPRAPRANSGQPRGSRADAGQPRGPRADAGATTSYKGRRRAVTTEKTIGHSD
jgi:hypothetical protein